MNYSQGLEFLYINNYDEKDPCKKWVPSLFSPILIANTENIYGIEYKKLEEVEIPPKTMDSPLSLVIIYGFNFIFLDQYDILLAKKPFQNIPYCYFGL